MSQPSAAGDPEAETAVHVAQRPPLALVFAVTVSGILATTLVSAPLPDILRHFDVSPSATGLVNAASALPGVVLAPVIGLLADRFGRRRVLLPCLVAFGMFGLASGLAPSFPLLLLFRLGQGFGAAGLINLAVVIIGDFWGGLDRARIIGYNAAVLTVSLAIFPAVGGVLAQLGGWRLAFAPYAVALVTAGFVLTRLPHDHAGRRTDRRLATQLRDAADVLRTPLIVTSLVYGFILFVLLFALLLTVLPVLLADEFGLQPAARGMVFASPAALSTVVALSLGKLRHRFGAGRLLIAATAIFAVSFALVGLAPNLGVLLVGVTMYGIGEGLSIPTLQDVVAGSAPDESRGAVVAVWVSAVRLGQFAGLVIGGPSLASLGSQETFVVGAAVPALLLGVLAMSPLRQLERARAAV